MDPQNDAITDVFGPATTTDHPSFFFNPTENAHLLSLQEIAAWQVEGIHGKSDKTSICAVLPALQRGAVWSAAQAEALWDSLVRGFPMGAFLLAHYDKNLGQQDYKLLGHCSNGNPERTFHLLDGQQRATAIALGFFNLWSSGKEIHNDGPALWVDLALPTDERVFVFRVLTRSHPWGYQSKDPKSRLSNRDIADAMDCFRSITDIPKVKDARSTTLPIRNAWPWDAACPLPVPLLIESATNGDNWRNALLKRLQNIPLWHDDAKLKGGGQLIALWQNALDEKNLSDSTSHSARLEKLMSALQRELLSRRIPGLIMPKSCTNETNAERDIENNQDSVETLFVRINSAGTNLGGEELIYSLLKSTWPQAPDVIKSLQPNNRQVISPARMVTFLARLEAAWLDGKFSEVPPQTPSVAVFRKTMQSKIRRDSLFAFVKNAKPVIEDLLELVLLAPHSQIQGNHTYCLPPTLAAQLFSGERGLDTLLMVSAWLMRLHASGKRLKNLSLKQRKQTLGFVVAVNWFAEDDGVRLGHSLRRLWPKLRSHSTETIGDFFNKTRFHLLLPTEPDGKLVMLPIVPPDILDKLIQDRVTGGCSGYPGPKNDQYWEVSDKWTHYYNRIAPDEFSKLHSLLQDWLRNISLDVSATQESDAQGDESNLASRLEQRRFAWYQFMEKLWGNRRIVDYAQRAWLMRWFHDFDPTLPGQMEDINRPWDYDHIHPQSLGSSSSIRSLPAVIREWHTSIGNLRAWPLELNRGDQDGAPAIKLDTINPHTQRFQLNEKEILRVASFIGENEDWLHWKISVPKQLKNNKYLLHAENNDNRVALIVAITTRFRRLYREWYESFALDKLMQEKS